uniref:Retrovirus-related Pol polyprotein from transposon TNT 1-94 n=1 Tax=Tanacetum cinerariifolium TaxID=118510 RepID=A0A6L2KHA5_TANCI|nr:retrovirus-related Pol polyprotein from transposon TNT 1-94 [Tanacetum cinerariifolium]
MESLNSNSQERGLNHLQQMQANVKESYMVSFRLLHSYLNVLSNNNLRGTRIKGGFERAFTTLFEQDVQTFTRTMLLNLDQLEKHLFKEEFQELESFSAFRVLLQQFQTFPYSRFLFDNDEGLMIRKYFIAYTKTDVLLFHDKLILYMESLRESIQERAKNKREYDRRMNDRMMQSKEGNVDLSKALDAGLVVAKNNETDAERHVQSSRSRKDTHVEDADINSVNDKQPMAEVKLTAGRNILANEQKHYEQSESTCDTYLLEKVDRNTTPVSIDMSQKGGEIDQNTIKLALEPAVSTESLSSTTVDQDAPLPSNSQTSPETQSPVISNDVEEENHDLDVAHMNNNPFFSIPIPENDSESSSLDVIPTVLHTIAPNSEHVTKYTKDHPLDNIIIMQEELHEFERLKVWELIPRLDNVMDIILKWIYKVKLDELGGILKNKACLVARGYQQEEGIGFEKYFALSTRLDAI